MKLKMKIENKNEEHAKDRSALIYKKMMRK